MNRNELDSIARQRDEIEALRSIFIDEFRYESLETQSVWGKTVPAEFSILVKTQESSTFSSMAVDLLPSIRMHIRYTSLYPSTPPTITLKEPKNLSQTDQVSIHKEIEAEMKNFIGSEMIFDLVNVLGSILKRFDRSKTTSLIDERDRRMKAAMDKASVEDSKRQLEERNLRSLHEESMRKQIEASLKVQSQQSAQMMTHLNEIRPVAAEEVRFNIPLRIKGFSIHSLRLSLPIHDGEQGRCCPWLTYVADVGTIVIKEYSFEQRQHELLREFEAMLAIVQKQLHSVIGVDNYGWSIISSENMWKVYIAQQHVSSGSLRNVLCNIGKIPLETAKRWLINLAEELVVAHRLGVFHRRICAANILLVMKDGRTTGSFCDWEYAYIAHKTDGIHPKEDRAMFFKQDRSQSVPSAKDVLDLCVVFLQMMLGELTAKDKSLEDLLAAHQSRIRPDVYEFMYQVVLDRKLQSITASDLLSMEFLRTVNDAELYLAAQTPLASATLSRYATDFEELSNIGQGAYGVVVKARNRLDGRVYAVKKIFTGTESRVLREISGLARLNHPSIVRYFGSWMESSNDPVAQSLHKDSDSDSDASTEDNSYFISDDFMSSNGIVFAHPGDLEGETKGCELSGQEKQPHVSTLFIQMEYCSGNTLRSLIDDKKVGPLYWSYFAQIVDGVKYIHHQGLIHRDLKPANIFVSADGQLKLGDFGLAMESVPQQSAQPEQAGSNATYEDGRTGKVGTFLYQAPELSLVPTKYDAKIDIYALGIILGEMTCTWSTGMERIILLRGLRSAAVICPLEVINFSREVDLLKSLLSHDPSLRPSAEKLASILPPVVHKSYLQDTFKLLAEDRVFKGDVLSHLFMQTSGIGEFIYDANAFTVAPIASLLVEEMTNKIRMVFKTHGCIDRAQAMTGLFPFNSAYYENGQTVKVLDEVSNVLQLPFDFKVPFARQIARYTSFASFDRSYMIGPVYRSIHGRIKALTEADFDLVSTSPLVLNSALGEGIRVLYEIQMSLGMSSDMFEVVLGHSGLARLILARARVPERDQSTVLGILVTLVHKRKQTSLNSWIRSLGSLVPESTILELFKFRPDRSLSFETQVDRTLDLLATPHPAGALEARSILFDCLQAIKGYGIELPVSFTPFAPGFLLYSLSYSFNFLGKANDILAVGGLYTDLVSSLRIPGSDMKQLYATGFGLSIDKMCRLAERVPQGQFNQGQLDVVINAKSSEARAVELIIRLWDLRISAELCHLDDASALCAQRGAKFLLTIREKRLQSSSGHTIRAKNLMSGESEDVSLDALGPHLLGELAEMLRTSKKPAIPRLERTTTHRKEPEIIIISTDEQRRQKNSLRDTISTRALECARLLTEQLEESAVPILVVEFDSEHMQLLRSLNPRAKEDATYKRTSEQMTSVITRTHFASLRQSILRLQEAGKTYCLLYSYKCAELVLVPI